MSWAARKMQSRPQETPAHPLEWPNITNMFTGKGKMTMSSVVGGVEPQEFKCRVAQPLWHRAGWFPTQRKAHLGNA